MNRSMWCDLKVKSALCAAVLAILGACVSANPLPRNSKEQAAEKTAPTANASDVASIESIVAALYDVISGPDGKKRDWDRMRSLFVPYARMIPVGRRANGEMEIAR